jgi:flagellar motility protein MotE (MotC chaperone)
LRATLFERRQKAISSYQKERLEASKQAIDELATKQGQTGEQLRQTVEGRLDLLRSENTAELEKVSSDGRREIANDTGGKTQ